MCLRPIHFLLIFDDESYLPYVCIPYLFCSCSLSVLWYCDTDIVYTPLVKNGGNITCVVCGGCLSIISLTKRFNSLTHICVSKLTIIGSDNGLSPGQRQTIIWPNAGILLIRTLGTNFREILSEIRTFSFKKIHLKMSSGKRRPFCLGLNVF